jgi:hypothetical protein
VHIYQLEAYFKVYQTIKNDNVNNLLKFSATSPDGGTPKKHQIHPNIPADSKSPCRYFSPASSISPTPILGAWIKHRIGQT